MITKKQDRIENTVDSTKPDVIMVTEICLDPFTTDNQPPKNKLQTAAYG